MTLSKIVTNNKKLLILLGFVLLGGFLFYSYRHAGNGPLSPLPVIHTDTKPYKIKPENRGGMQLAHRDNSLAQIIEDRRDWEDDTPTQTIEANQSPRIIPTQSAEKREKQSREAPAAIDKAEQDKDLAKSSEDKTDPETALKLEPILERLNVKKPEIKPQAPTPAQRQNAREPAEPGTHFIQMGAFRSNEEAEQAYIRFQNRYNTTLSSYNKRIQSVDIEGKGTFYRVQFGPQNAERARQDCETLKKQGGSCYVVGR